MLGLDVPDPRRLAGAHAGLDVVEERRRHAGRPGDDEEARGLPRARRRGRVGREQRDAPGRGGAGAQVARLDPIDLDRRALQAAASAQRGAAAEHLRGEGLLTGRDARRAGRARRREHDGEREGGQRHA